MTNAKIKQVLLNHNVRHLYHTNTVETSLSFLKSGGLLSRGLCEEMGLPQTRQYTDYDDKKYNIYYDIFFDSMEIQRRTGVSYYGPVLFVYNVDVLDSVKEESIRITKKNPDKWKNTTREYERYFIEIDELSFCFDENNFGQHITLKNQKQPLSFDYLEKIVLSDPRKNDNSLFENAKAAIRETMYDKRLDIPFIIRDYNYNGRFINTYEDSQKLHDHYSLGGHGR